MVFWFQKNNFTDEKDRQVAHMLSMLIYASWAAYLVVLLFGLFEGDRKMVALTLLGSVIQLVPFGLLKRRHLFASSWIFSFEVLVTITFLATVGQGYRDIALFAFPIILIFTGMTLSRPIFILNIGLMLLSLGWLVFGQMNGWYVPMPIRSGAYWTNFLLISTIVLVSAYAIDLLVKNMRENFKRAQTELANRQEAEESLKESEKKYRTLIETTDTGFLILDGDGRVLDANREYVRLSGHAELHEILGRQVMEWTAEHDKQRNSEAVAQCLLNRKIRNFIVDYTDKNGGCIPVEINATIHGEGTSLRIISLCRDVAERIRAEKMLRASEEKYRNLFHNAAIGIFHSSFEGRFLDVNPALAGMLGYDTPEAVISGITNIAEQVYSEPQRWISVGNTAQRAEDLITAENRYRRKDGTFWYGKMRLRVVQGRQGEPDFYEGFVEDITERTRAVEALKSSESQLNHLFDHSPNAIAFAHKGLYIRVNDRYLALFGYARSEIIGKSILEVVPPGSQEQVQALRMKRECGEIESLIFETRGRRKDGEEFDLEIESSICIIEGKEYSIAHHHDITERKQAQEALQESRNRLELAATSAQLGIWDWDIINNKMLWDDRMFRLYGIAEKPARYGVEICKNGLHADDIDAVWEACQAALRGEKKYDIEFRVRHPDGLIRYIKADGIVLRDEAGKALRMIGVNHDITEKKKLLADMQRIDKLDSLGILAGGIAHDFNNLLGGIFGYIEMARESSTSNKTVVKYLDKALRVFERAKDLTQQLLTFSKGGAPKRKTGRLGTLIKESAAFVLSGTNVGCEYSIASDLWLCDFDENQIGQVIDNIVINAQQAMPLGGTITVSVNNICLKANEKPALKGCDYIRISITDTGTGIPPEMLKRIFDPFFTTKQKGNGLGLATCYSIIQKHDGCIDVESVPGKGTTFHVFLPASHKGTVRDMSGSSSEHQGKGSILVMDDEDFMREIVGDMLTDMGYSVLEAKHGEEALQAFDQAQRQGKPIRAALFDLTIPGGMGGREAIIKVRLKYPDMPVFASSGFSEDPVMARPNDFGFTDSIRKPFKKVELAELLNKHFKGLLKGK